MTTTHSAGPRVDSPTDLGYFAWRPYWQRTHYPDLGLYVHTAWWTTHRDGERACSVVSEGIGNEKPRRYEKDYDPARITVGGLAEAHEAVCARVEWGELP